MKPIDVEATPGLGQIVEEVCKTNAAVVLRQNGKVVAMIELVGADAKRKVDQHRIVEYEALRRSAGDWDRIVDVDEFREGNRESRRRSSRPPVSL